MPSGHDETDARSSSKRWQYLSAAGETLRSRLGDARDRATSRLRSSRVADRFQEYAADWPTAVDAQIDVGDSTPSATDLPEGGEIVCYVHGFLGEGRLDSVPASGAHQAAALEAALAEEYADREADPPAVVAVMWDASTAWWRAKRRTRPAGETFAAWLDAHREEYETVRIVGHSLGARVTLWTLASLTEATVDSVSLLGAAVAPEAVCTQFREPIEARVRRSVDNYHSENDTAVCHLYRLTERHPGLGCHGSDCGDGMLDSHRRPANYTDVDVTEQVAGHLNYYQPVVGSDDDGCIGTLVDRQLDASDS